MAILMVAEHNTATLSYQAAKALPAALQIGSDMLRCSLARAPRVL